MRKLLLTLLLFMLTTINSYADKVVRESTGMTLIKFGAKWCPPCRSMAPEIASYTAHHPEISVWEKDIDKEADQKQADKLKVISIPTIILFKKGKEVARHSGFMTEAEIDKFVKENS